MLNHLTDYLCTGDMRASNFYVVLISHQEDFGKMKRIPLLGFRRVGNEKCIFLGNAILLSANIDNCKHWFWYKSVNLTRKSSVAQCYAVTFKRFPNLF